MSTACGSMEVFGIMLCSDGSAFHCPWDDWSCSLVVVIAVGELALTFQAWEWESWACPPSLSRGGNG